MRSTRIRTPTLLQREAVECGAVALAIVLHHYDCYASIEELRVRCHVSRDGSSALSIKSAAESYGLECRGLQLPTLPDIKRLALPAILFWQENHFVVLEGYDEQDVYINDPLSGARTLSYEVFLQAYSHIALELTPGDDFQTMGAPFNLWQALRDRLTDSRVALTFVVLSSLFLIVPTVLIPVFLRVFVDDVLVAGRDWLIPLLAGMSIALVLRLLLTWLQERTLLRLRIHLTGRFSTEFLQHLLSLPSRFFHQRFAGDLVQRVHMNTEIARLISDDLPTSAVNILLIVVYGAVLALFDIWLALIGFGFAALSMLVLIWLTRRRMDANSRLLRYRGQLSGIMMTTFRSIESVKASSMEQMMFERLMSTQAAYVAAQQKLAYSNQLLNASIPFFFALNTVTILIVGGLRILDGVMTAGTLVAFQSLMYSFMQPANQLISLGAQLQTTQGDLQLLDDVLNHPRRPKRETASVGEVTTGHLICRDVSFRYTTEPLLQDVNMSLQAGQRIGLIGRTGCGKTTLARLLVGLHEPGAGTIHLDGIPLNHLTRRTHARSVALVDQKITLFSDSIHANITLWDETCSRQDVQHAARITGLHDFIQTLADGYDTQLTEDGMNLSGGQRQCLEMARAIVQNPAVLILDEATRALDETTEARILKNLSETGCTVLLITHRLPVLKMCNYIYVMEAGKIVEHGSHNTLLNNRGIYTTLSNDRKADSS